jgi:hypothetical protein
MTEATPEQIVQFMTRNASTAALETLVREKGEMRAEIERLTALWQARGVEIDRLRAGPAASGITIQTHKMPLPEALAEKQKQVDYWGHRAEKAEAKVEQLTALSAELCEAMDDCITWLSSGFAPQSQSIALEKAAKARARFRALEGK